ncbi:MAG: T9SS type A sorting domain-containing protein [Flavobacterium sp.]|nr:T9SS type A sorting domain-containing protein [Flavobacterium sp.]
MRYFFTILLLHLYSWSSAQITYSKLPLDLQIVARDKTSNLGIVNIEGVVDIASGYESLRVETYRNNVLLNNNDKTLEYTDSKANFSYTISIPAELANYTFKIYGFKPSVAIYELNKTISNIVAEDAIIIQGQSNAVASIRNGSANSNKSEFIRVYANGIANVDALLSNDTWYLADGDVNTTTNGNAGQWGLKLARLLSDNLNIPIAVFNGAHNGQGISFFKATKDYKTSLSSNYGRLYYRLNKTGLINSVRSVFWSQGEANSGSNFNSISSYKNNFKIIENSWLADLPNLEKIYIFQTKDCACNTTPEGLMNIKEAQRQLAVEDDKISIMPTTSLLLHTDICHFPFKNGYETFATRIHKLVLQDVYGKSYSEEIKAPTIKSIEFTEPNTLTLETDALELKFSSTDQATMLTRLKQDFELRNAQNATIESVNLAGNKILFTLSGNPGSIANVSFVGYYSNIGYTITNSSNLELVSFRNFPIKNLSLNDGDSSNYPIIEDAHICTIFGSTTSIPVLSPNINASHKLFYKTLNEDWTEISSSNASTIYSNYNSPILEIKKSSILPISGTIYKVVAAIGLLEEFTSNEATLSFDTAPVSKLITSNSAICEGESSNLLYDIDSIGTIQWQYSTTSSQEDFIDLYDENGLSYTISNLQQTTWFRVMNSNGVCTNNYSPAVQIKVDPKPISGIISGGNISVCKTTNSTVLILNNYIGKIQWQKATTLTGVYSNIINATSDLYTTSGLISTTYFRAIVTSGICLPQISEPVAIIVESSAVSKTITGASPICVGDSKTLSYGMGSVGTIQWQYSIQSGTTGFFDIIDENSLTYTITNLQQPTWFRVKNYIGTCSTVYSPAVQVLVNPKPISGYITGGNKSVCKTSNSTILNLNNSFGTIQWQKSATESGVYSNITSTTSNSIAISGLTTTTYYRAILSGNFCVSQITEPTVIAVDDVSVAKTILGASSVCAGDSKTLNYETGSVGSIQWEYSNVSNSTGFLEINDQKETTYTATNLQQNTWYRVKNTNGTCTSVYSPAIQLTVIQKPIAGYITGGDLSVCKTSNSTVLKLLNYVGEIQWQKASSFSGTYSNIFAATSNSFTAINLTTTTFYRAKLSNGICTPVFTEPVAINISINAESKTISGAVPICSGESLTLSYGIGSIGSINWQFSITSSSSGFTDIVGQNDLNYTANNLQKTTWFRVKNSIGTCSTTYSPAVQVTITSKPVAGNISGGNINICKTTSAITLTLNKSIGNIQWQKSSIITGDYSNITSANSASYSVSGLTSSGYFRAVLSNGICTQEITEPVSIRIDDLAVTKTISSASPICVGENKTLSYGEGSVGTIQWQYSTVSNTTGFVDINGENDLNYTATNLQQTTWFRVKNTSGVCPINHSPAVQITVNLTPMPFGDKTQYFDFDLPVTINNIEVEGTDVKWYWSYTDAQRKDNDLEYTTKLIPDTTYFATQTLNGCTSISPLTVTAISNLEIKGFNTDKLTFYPNPFTNYFKLKYPEIITSIELFNNLGQSVLKTNPNDKETTLSANHLPSGIYFMEVSSKKNKGIIKAIKL